METERKGNLLGVKFVSEPGSRISLHFSSVRFPLCPPFSHCSWTAKQIPHELSGWKEAIDKGPGIGRIGNRGVCERLFGRVAPATGKTSTFSREKHVSAKAENWKTEKPSACNARSVLSVPSYIFPSSRHRSSLLFFSFLSFGPNFF